MHVVIIGPFPPPVHGMAKNLKIFAEDIGEQAPVVKINTSPGRISKSYIYHFTKLFRVLGGLLKLFLLALTRRVSAVYIPPDGGIGAYYTLCFVVITKLFSVPIYMHHRSFQYINKSTFAMKVITFIQPKSACHIYLCGRMKVMFEKIYGVQEGSIIVSNAQYVKPVESIIESGSELVIGHLSNLGFGKGLRQVFEVCVSLKEANVPFRLELGGPAEDENIQEYIDMMIVCLGPLINYHGLITPNNKGSFYSTLDVFLFPTEYKNEAQPNVLFEANAAGVPVFSIGIGCIGEDVDCRNGHVFESQASFSIDAPQILEALSKDRIGLIALKNSTLSKIKTESMSSKKGYETLIDQVLRRVK